MILAVMKGLQFLMAGGPGAQSSHLGAGQQQLFAGVCCSIGTDSILPQQYHHCTTSILCRTAYILPLYCRYPVPPRTAGGTARTRRSTSPTRAA